MAPFILLFVIFSVSCWLTWLFFWFNRIRLENTSIIYLPTLPSPWPHIFVEIRKWIPTITITTTLIPLPRTPLQSVLFRWICFWMRWWKHCVVRIEVTQVLHWKQSILWLPQLPLCSALWYVNISIYELNYDNRFAIFRCKYLQLFLFSYLFSLFLLDAASDCFGEVAKRLAHCCYRQEWYFKSGGCTGISHLTSKLPVHWLRKQQVIFVKALLFILKVFILSICLLIQTLILRCSPFPLFLYRRIYPLRFRL